MSEVFDTHTILGVHVTNRLTEAVSVQKLLSEYGHQIKTRIGLHDVTPTGASARSGLLLLEMVGDPAGIQALADELNAITGVEVQSMVFHHPE